MRTSDVKSERFDGTANSCGIILNSIQKLMPTSKATIALDTGLDVQLVDDAIQFMTDVGLPLELDHEGIVRLYRRIIPLDIDYVKEIVSKYDNVQSSMINIQDSVNSTNEYLLERSGIGSIHRLVCIAEHMSHGRGSRNRRWVAGAFENIMLSIGWEFHDEVRNVSGLSLAVAVMVVHSLTRLTQQEFQVKWPNDVLWENRKIAGILVEIRNSTVVVGVGINCRLSESDRQSIDQPAVDLAEFYDIAPKRSELAGNLIIELSKGLALFFREGLMPFKDEWMDFHAYQGRNMQAGDQEITGVALGINDSGAFLLKLRDSRIIPVFAGDVRPVD